MSWKRGIRMLLYLFAGLILLLLWVTTSLKHWVGVVLLWYFTSAMEATADLLVESWEVIVTILKLALLILLGYVVGTLLVVLVRDIRKTFRSKKVIPGEYVPNWSGIDKSGNRYK